MDQFLVDYFFKGAIAGASKTQLCRTFQRDYGWTDEELDAVLKDIDFKKKPKKVDYSYFNNLPFKACATRMPYPFTQMYVKKDFLNKEECEKLIDFIDDSLGPSTVADKQIADLSLLTEQAAPQIYIFLTMNST